MSTKNNPADLTSAGNPINEPTSPQPTPTPAITLGMARTYTKLGLSVFPLQQGAKTPIPGSHGHKQATTEAAQLDTWWEAQPNANLGIRCDTVTVVDVDSEAAHAALKAELGDLDALGVVKTPRGYHYYLPATVDLDQTVNLRNGVDVRAKGRGYVVAPPSIVDGTPYYWLTVFNPKRAITTAWEALKPKPGATETTATATPPTPGTHPWIAAKLEAKLATLAATQPGSRNATLNAVALDLAHYIPSGYLDEPTLAAQLTDSARSIGLARAEIAATIRSAFTVGKLEPRTPPTLPPPPTLGHATQADPQADPTTGEIVILEQDLPDGGKKSTATVLVEMALAKYRLGKTPDNLLFGVPEGSHIIRVLRGGDSLRAELARDYYRKTGKAATQSALADALTVLEGVAQDKDAEPVHRRSAKTSGTLWVDIGDETEQVIRIDANGWTVTDTAPVLFARSALTKPLPTPKAGGTLDDLWGLVNVTEQDRPLLAAWLVSAWLLTDAPVPILALFGEQGTGKSSASRILIDLIDPATVPLRKPPKDMDSWTVAATGSRVVGLDNLSTVPDWFADSLCRAVTGDGDVRRKLYSDGALSVFAVKIAILLNGIDLGGLRGDLADRLVMVSLDQISTENRVTETELARRWEACQSGVLGALLGAMGDIMRRVPFVELESKPRMADFAKVLAALDQTHGTLGLARFEEQAATLAADVIATDPFIAALVERLPGDGFRGTSAELLSVLAPLGPPRFWPNARAVTGKLLRAAPALRRAGWRVEREQVRLKHARGIWTLESSGNGVTVSPLSPNSRLTRGNAGFEKVTPGDIESCTKSVSPGCHPRNDAITPSQSLFGDKGDKGDTFSAHLHCVSCGKDMTHRKPSTNPEMCLECYRINQYQAPNQIEAKL